jgi:hypothetical protein
VPVGPPPGGVGLSHAANRTAETNGVFVAQGIAASLPSLLRGLPLTQQADDAPGGMVVPNLPGAEAFAREQIPPADRAHRHRALILGPAPDGYS